MRMPKKYGESRIDNCPFCGKIAVTKNNQGVPVCLEHKTAKLDEIRCVCGSWLEIMEGKWGPYFRCINCGNVNFRKGIEMNSSIKSDEKKDVKQSNEITVTSDQVDFMY